MTPEEYKAHAEQMDAARAEFNRHWQAVLLPELVRQRKSPREIGAVMHAAWRRHRGGGRAGE